ncbi:HAD-IIB family hydrolase, partial [Staphylococcus aureus]
MQPHLICLDLDGTLLNDNKEISSYTKQVLNELQQRGHQIMIATGRPYRASQMYYHELNLTTPIVNFNGAYVHHPKDKNFKTWVLHQMWWVYNLKNYFKLQLLEFLLLGGQSIIGLGCLLFFSF